ncbi:hypothetical protein [Allorhodopirellula solitaria]|uniref:Vitamin K-dependent gamma-carboxylase n=1 Tax=Allorhodopirellula solitaria TaxID=2527987 RepID=A0A5C5XS53_9BACT|nr:hypothetical protein [Allorhodopirellula solitaria]TWT66076.1 hypothetical protein CA85_29380 [Allorhodopirellula solitaria]
MLLIVATYPLWLPAAWTQTAFYPAIPLVALPHGLQTAISILLAPVIIAATAVILLRPDRQRCQQAAWASIAVVLATGFLTDQHRLQPWAYQTFLYACLFVLLPMRWQTNAFRVLTISIYFFSSVGKFDYQFLHTVGQEFLVTAARFAHLDIAQWDARTRLIAAAGFPAAELSIAILLTIPRTRFLAGCLAIFMHASLIALLSPWGLHHSLGVLLWNAVLAGQAYWLFVYRPKPGIAPSGATSTGPLRLSAAALMILLALILPLTERRGRYDDQAWHWDHWLSWALYSPHNSRLDVEVYSGAVSGLPAGIASAVDEDRDGDSWCKLDLGKLSLQTRGVPILPQGRYQLRLATAIAEPQGWTHEIRGVLRSASDRQDGSRTEVWLPNLEAMQRAAKR